MSSLPVNRTFLIALLARLLALGCSKPEGPDCGQVSGHFIELVRSELAKQNTDEARRSAQANLPTLKDALPTACETQNWDLKTRQCIVSARSAAETEVCDPRIAAPAAGGDSAATQD